MGAYAESSLAHDLPDELRRLQLLEALADPMTSTILDRIDIQPHWRILDVGAGAGSVARMLARRARTGEVVATDMDTRFLPVDVPRLTAMTHDVTKDHFPPESFDLIHARLVLEHIPDRDQVMARMIGWLAPGGWLVIEGIDESPSLGSPYPPVRAAMTALLTMLERQLGTETGFARRATGVMRAAKFRDVALNAKHINVGDGGPGDAFLGAMVQRFAPAMIEAGVATAEEIGAMTAWLADPDGIDVAALFLAAVGRK